MLLLVLLFTLVASPSWATTYIVDNTHGSALDSNACTAEELPCLTISGGVTKALVGGLAGDRVQVKTGTYSETVTITSSGAVNNPFILENFPGHTPVIDRTGTTQRGICLGCNFNSASQIISHITVQGFEIRNAYEEGIKYIHGNGLTLRHNTIHDVGYRHNTETNSGSDGASGIFGNGTNITITHNRIYHIGNFVSHSGHALYVTGGNYTITNNVLYDCANTCGQMASYHLIASSPGTAYSGFHDSLIAHNTFGYADITQGKIGLVIWDAGPGGNGGYDATLLTNVEVHNNLFFKNRIHFSLNGANAYTGITVKNNVYYDPVGDQDFITKAPASVYTQSGNCPTSHTDNSCATNPNLTNATTSLPASPDFTLTSSSSIVIGQGLAATCSLVRASSTCDVGAYESFSATQATATGNTVDVTLDMSANVPVLPATGQTTWVVKFSGVARTTTSAVRLTGTDSVVRITFDGAACQSTDTMTVDYTSGTVTDSATIGNTNNQKLFSFTALAVDASACTGGGGGPPPTGPEIEYHLNDGSGTSVTDSSGNANTGTTTGNPTWTTGTIDGALSFSQVADDYLTAPWGSGINPTSQSSTVCLFASPTSPAENKILAGTPQGSSQRAYIGTYEGNWVTGIQGTGFQTNNDFPVQSVYSLACVVFDSSIDEAQLWVNAVKGTSTGSNRPYTSYTWSGNWTFGQGNGWDVASYSPGIVIDEIFVYESALNQSEMTELYDSLVVPTPAPTGSYEQKTHKWQRLRKKANGDAEDFTISGTTNGITMSVMVGGAIELITQIDCTGADCDASAARLFFNVNGGTFSQVNDLCGTVCFYGATADADIVSGVVTCCLTGALTANDGTTQFISSAVPSFDLTQNASFVRRSVLKVGTDATAGDTVCFKEYHQTGNALDAYTPTAGACITIVGVAAGVGF